MIKLIATDMDDTLLNPQGQLTARTKAAAAEAMRRGVKFTLASGRMPQAMLSIARELGANGPIIGYNGALTIDPDTLEPIESLPVPCEIAREAAKLAEELGGHVQAYANGAYFYETENEFSRAYAESIHFPGYATGEKISECLQTDADKLLVIGEPEKIAKWAKIMQAHFGDRLSCAISRPHYIEVFRAGIDKSTALSALCRRFGFTAGEVAAFGDGENDLGMIGFAGHGYVMANAREPIRARAKNIAPSNAEDGLAQILETWFKNGMIPERQEENA